ncbi:MAG: tonB-system energizer ExbB, partial [Mesorhizobium sp.]
MSRHGLFAALLASVILSAGGAAAQEQPGAVPAIEAPAPAPGEAAPDAVVPPAQPGVTTPTETTPIETGPSTATSLTLPHDLSPWGMFIAADMVVKAEMIGLAFA